VSGTALLVEAHGLPDWQRLARRVASMCGTGDRHQLLEEIGAEVESQTRRRISEEKTSPDGEKWPAWSDAYAATRHEGQSLLEAEGYLLDSLQFAVSGDQVEVGSNLVYAAIQEFGGAEVGKPGLPARSYLGLSDENAADVEAIADRWIDRQLWGRA
jgi:phage virion morphogenesis protein